MAQLIEVRFINPVDNAVLHDCFTQASSHREAVELALRDFSGGVGVLKAFEQVEAPTFVPAGTNTCWRSRYSCTLEDDEFDRECIAVLFAEYRDEQPRRSKK